MGRYRRYVIALAIVVVLIGVYAAAGFLAVPYFARRGAAGFRAHALRPHARHRRHPFQPLHADAGCAAARAARCRRADAAVVRTSARRSAAGDLWRFAPSFRAIILEQPYVRAVIRPDGAAESRRPRQGICARTTAAAAKAGTAAVVHPALRGDLRHRRLSRIAPGPRRFTPSSSPSPSSCATSAPPPAPATTYTLNAASPEGERLIWSGTLRLEPLSSHGVFEIADLQARTVWNYLRESLPFEIDSGVIGIKGDYDLASGGGPARPRSSTCTAPW